MAILVTCSKCGATYAVPEERAGKTGHCKCGGEIYVPDLATAQRAPAAAERPVAPVAANPAVPEVECRHCGMQTPPGKTCKWCDQPLAPPRVEEEHSVLLGGGSAGTHAHHAPAPAIHAEHAAPHAGLHRHEVSDRGPEAPMPSTVRAIRILMLLGILLMGLATVAAATGGAAVAGDSGVAAGAAGMMAVVFGIATVLSFALWFALGKASTAAWWIYVILAGLNVLAAPVRFVGIALQSKAAPEVVEAMGQAASSGAYQSGQWAGAIFGLIIAIVILYYWVQPDVKRWYGVS